MPSAAGRLTAVKAGDVGRANPGRLIVRSPRQPERQTMTSLALRVAILTGIGIAAMTLPAAASLTTAGDRAVPIAAAAAQYAQQGCWVDDGYGRRRPCDAIRYKSKKKNKR